MGCWFNFFIYKTAWNKIASEMFTIRISWYLKRIMRENYLSVADCRFVDTFICQTNCNAFGTNAQVFISWFDKEPTSNNFTRIKRFTWLRFHRHGAYTHWVCSKWKDSYWKLRRTLRVGRFLITTHYVFIKCVPCESHILRCEKRIFKCVFVYAATLEMDSSGRPSLTIFKFFFFLWSANC